MSQIAGDLLESGRGRIRGRRCRSAKLDITSRSQLGHAPPSEAPPCRTATPSNRARPSHSAWSRVPRRHRKRGPAGQRGRAVIPKPLPGPRRRRLRLLRCWTGQDRLTERLGLDRFRCTCLTAARRSGSGSPPGPPERITEIISWNGNVYAEELSDCWNPVRACWKDPSEANREAIRTSLVPQTAIWQRPRHKAGQPRRLRARQLPPRSQRRR